MRGLNFYPGWTLVLLLDFFFARITEVPY